MSEDEVRSVVLLLKNKSPGNDQFSTSVAKQMLEMFITPFTYIVNNSFKYGFFPDCLKIAKVIPIFKSGSKTIFTNYRPISILSFFSKVLEKIMYLKLIYFLEVNNILYD